MNFNDGLAAKNALSNRLKSKNENFEKELSPKRNPKFIFHGNIKLDGQTIGPPNVLGIGAKKCGTIAFATFMGANSRFKVGKHVESHFLYKVSLIIYYRV